jgi:hypothetical protein
MPPVYYAAAVQLCSPKIPSDTLFCYVRLDTYDFAYKSVYESPYDLLHIRYLLRYESAPILNSCAKLDGYTILFTICIQIGWGNNSEYEYAYNFVYESMPIIALFMEMSVF